MSDKIQFIATARKRFEADCADENELRSEYETDIRMIAGDQWPEALKQARIAKNRPVLTFNRMPTFVQQVANEARQNRPQIKISPAEDGDKDTADVIEGLARHIQYDSLAQVAYETAVDCSAGGGFGFVRMMTEYCDEESDRQDLKILPVIDPLSVYGVLIAACFGRKPRHAFVIEELPKEEYLDLYGESELASDWDGGMRECRGWVGTETVRLAEYWTLKETIAEQITNLSTKRRRKTSTQVKFCKINGVEVLEGTETDWLGKSIPIYPVLGKLMIVDGKPQLASVVRHQRGPQQLINGYKTRIAETLSVAPISQFIADPKQIEGYEKDWAEANTTPLSILRAHFIVNGQMIGPPQRQAVEPPIQAYSMAARDEIDDLKATAGIYDPSLGAKSNSVSGVAKQRDQQQASLTNMHYIDNLGRAFDQIGKDMVPLVQLIYDDDRKQRILGNDMQPKIVKLNAMYQDEGGKQRNYKITAGKYDVVVNMERAFSTKRKDTFENMTDFVKAYPEGFPIIADQIFANSDMAGADIIAERYKKLLPPQLQDEDSQGSPEAQVQKLQSQMQAMAQQQELLTKALNEATETITTKKLELESKEHIVAIQEQTKLAIAELNAGIQTAQLDIQRLEAQLQAEMKQNEMLHKSAHEAGMQAQDQNHQSQMADKQAEYAAMSAEQQGAIQSDQMQQQAELAPAQQ